MALQKLLFSILILLPMAAKAQVDSIQPKTNWFQRGVRSVGKEMAFSGVPMAVISFGLRTSKEGFRVNNEESDKRTQLLHGTFHTEVDNYIQYAPVAAATVMNMAGVKGHSGRLRYLGVAVGSYVIEAGLVNLLKYTVREMRPDGSKDNSWPSGHTATAFVGATILHHEYGMTRSPWYSVGGYTVATATAALRVMNNRHWVTDVISGAGIGILSTEAAYAIADFFFKDKGINMPYKDDNADLLEHPSFIGFSEGFGVVRNSVSVGGKQFKFGFPVAISAEGAYNFCKYIGVGGRLRLQSSSCSNSSSSSSSGWQTGFSFAAGPYFRYPLNNRLALGTKLLVGREHNTDVVDEKSGDCLTVNKAMTYGTGVSLTYAYKNLYQWSVFCDYDVSPRTYTLNNVYTVKRALHSVMFGARLNLGI